MQILVACEESQAVTIALRKLGHEAYSCDLIPLLHQMRSQVPVIFDDIEEATHETL